jgi:hypothetical protein
MNEYKLKVYIDTVDKTDRIITDTFSITDEIDETPSVCNFQINVYEGETYSPNIGSDVIIYFDDDVYYSGKIIMIDNVGDRFSQRIAITCKDNTILLDNILITKRYTDTTVEDIIADIISDTRFGGAITDTNVVADIEITSITFNTISTTKCIQKLADSIGYYWYIDENNDIHFFESNTAISPFNLNDTDDNYIEDSLEYNLDLSQLKNYIRVKGGEKVSLSTKDYTTLGDGVTLNYSTVFKFSTTPTVSVDSVAQTVGTEYLDEEDDYDCFWSFSEKKIRFKVAPDIDDVIVFTGYPLTPITVLVEDTTSIDVYGLYEYTIENKSVRSTEEAKKLGNAQLTAYSNPILSLGFKTYKSGLKSGQNISVETRDISDTYLIQSVVLDILATNLDTDIYVNPIFSIKCSNTKTNNLTKFLQGLLLKDNLTDDLDDNTVLDFLNLDKADIIITENMVKSVLDLVGVLAPYYPTDLTTDTKRVGLLDYSLKYT